MAAVRFDVEDLRRLPPSPVCGHVGGTPRRHPWDLWTDGRAWELVEGVDFDSPRRNFRHQVHVIAKRRGLTACVRSDADDDRVLLIQFFPRERAK
jgi:hypothetical protein